MCFVIQADVIGSDARARRDYERVVPNTNGEVEWFVSKDKGKPLQLNAVGEYCTCSFIAGGPLAESKTTWHLLGDWVPQLVGAISWLYERSPRGITVWSMFNGRAARNEVGCSLDELLGLVKEHELGKETRYIVRKRSRLAV